MIGYGNSYFISTILDTESGVPPVNTAAPAITGTAQEGQTVTCSTGTWTGTPTITYTYQWKRNGSNIGSATNSTYLLVSADVGQSITCQVTATNGSGSASATSNTITPIAAFTGLLDTYPGAAVGYSLRKLRSAYSGSAIRVRRSSDNTEQNIGFVNNVLDTASLLTFCGAGNGFVTTWYDQSGNANNATQTTALNQPQIVSSGSLLLVNSKPCISFALNATTLILGSTISVGASSYNSFVGKKDGAGTNLQALTSAAADGYKLRHLFDNYYYLYAKPGSYIVSNSPDTTTSQMLLTGMNVAGTMSMYKNSNVLATTLNSWNYANLIGVIGGGASGSAYRIQEAVFYNSDKSSSRVGIETNINTFYTIY
jgi:hypothetical protein